MNNSNIFNPIYGLSANQIVRLFEQGTDVQLNENLRDLAIQAISKHLDFVPEATIQTITRAMMRITELRPFASVSYKCFLGEFVPTSTEQQLCNRQAL